MNNSLAKVHPELVSGGRKEFNAWLNRKNVLRDEVISGMVADAWYSVTEYHLELGTKDSQGNRVNGIERTVNKLASLNQD